MAYAPMGRGFGVAVSVVIAIWAAPLGAQQVASGIEPHHEYRKRTQSAEMPAALDTGLFGESISLYDGRTDFRVVDVDLPGNSTLPVQFARRLAIELQPQDEISAHDSRLLGAGNWDIEVPYVSATFPSASGWPATRCSVGSVPSTTGQFSVREHWNGISIHIPGRGDTPMLSYQQNTPRPTDGATYRNTTKERDAIDCIALSDGQGEGYRLTTTSGERYYFDRLVSRSESTLQKSIPFNEDLVQIDVYLPRARYYLLASRVEDRFGNVVRFTYNGSGHPTSIEANDGRLISLSYVQGRVSQVQANGRLWKYAYAARPLETELATVTLPDTSRWTYASTGSLLPSVNHPGDTLPPTAWCRTRPTILSADYGLTVTHPTGARGDFSFSNDRHARTGVHATECMKKGDPRYPEYARIVPEFFDVLSVKSKLITGPGLPPMKWTYGFGNQSPTYWGTPDSPPSYPCGTCMPTKTVTVVRPDGSTQQLTFGTLYRFNDGRQLGERILSASGAELSVTTTDYLGEGAMASQPFANEYGGILGAVNDPASVWVRPVVRTSTVREGTSYSWESIAFDSFARTVQSVRSGPSGSIREQVDFHDVPQRWLMGQARRLVNLDNGVVIAEAVFDSNAMPVRTYSFGLLTQSLSYRADGTVASIADGAGNTTLLSAWQRGLPTHVINADQTTRTLSVDGNGWVTAATDENGLTTRYTHDTMGRTKSVTYPEGGGAPWNATISSFAPSSSAQYGLPAGHWAHTISTGNARRITYFDGLWRPLLVREFDSSNAVLTQRFQRFAYDSSGNRLFESYPGSAPEMQNGNWTEYDALQRETARLQDSESGSLITVIDYLQGGRVRVTDPLGRQTTTSHQAFDKPNYELPTLIQRPAGVELKIDRNVFGNPTAIVQRGTTNGL
ncbi:RHS repeat domain-containing protein [Stenotrophomonas sp. WHRI 8082]|uniref:RHS repeat protein n=1 Tax=Stenotrophomonas sp. WHRI 8082 TaxID=3162571 RepID=UPI0032ECCE48